jgi:hypothetical protein
MLSGNHKAVSFNRHYSSKSMNNIRRGSRSARHGFYASPRNRIIGFWVTRSASLDRRPDRVNHRKGERESA